MLKFLKKGLLTMLARVDRHYPFQDTIKFSQNLTCQRSLYLSFYVNIERPMFVQLRRNLG